MSKMHICTCPSTSLNAAWHLKHEVSKINSCRKQNHCLYFLANAHCRAFVFWCEAGGKLGVRTAKRFVFFFSLDAFYCGWCQNKSSSCSSRFPSLAEVHAHASLSKLIGVYREYLQPQKIKAKSLQGQGEESDIWFSLFGRNYIFHMDELIDVMKKGKERMNLSPSYYEMSWRDCICLPYHCMCYQS